MFGSHDADCDAVLFEKCVAIFHETRRDIPISLGSEKSATAMPSAARDVLRPLRLALRAAPQLPQ